MQLPLKKNDTENPYASSEAPEDFYIDPYELNSQQQREQYLAEVEKGKRELLLVKTLIENSACSQDDYREGTSDFNTTVKDFNDRDTNPYDTQSISDDISDTRLIRGEYSEAETNCSSPDKRREDFKNVQTQKSTIETRKGMYAVQNVDSLES